MVEESSTNVVFSSVDWVGLCLVDGQRTRAFERAISRAVRKGDLVLDVGTGSGILALFAARAGAGRVVAIEIDPYLVELARENIARNHFDHVIEVVEADATSYQLDPHLKFDLVIMELLTTGMIDEHQVEAINNLHRQRVLKETTRFIPERQDTFVQLTSTDFRLYGFDMRFPLHLWYEAGLFRRVRFLSNQALLSSVDFRAPVALHFSERVSLELCGDESIPDPPNSLYLTSSSVLDAEVAVGHTFALNAPIAIPLIEGVPLPLASAGGGRIAD